MKLIKANLWDFYDQGAWIGITINGEVKANGHLVMGAGIAQQAAKRIPDLSKRAGEIIHQHGLRSWGFTGLRVVLFPTKYHWRGPSNTDLIRSSAEQLAETLKAYPTLTAEQPLYLAAPGTGLGGLTWGKVEPLLKALEGLNVVCVTKGDESS